VAWEGGESRASLQSPGRGRSRGRDWQLGEGEGLEPIREKALAVRQEVLPSCWRGVSCSPQRGVELSESLARPARRHPRARTRSAAASLLRSSPRPPGASSSPASGRHIWPAPLPGARGAGSREGAARRRSPVGDSARCARAGL
jgi:hypothetical protein